MTIQHISTRICQHFGIEISQLKSKSRLHSDARKWFYYLCKINGLKEPQIAKYIHRDRSTINDVFSRLNKRVDKFKSLQTIKEKLTIETEIN
jgi:chromosomal replication initiation ATPase DnaA